jgi:hypothetical protein
MCAGEASLASRPGSTRRRSCPLMVAPTASEGHLPTGFVGCHVEGKSYHLPRGSPESDGAQAASILPKIAGV